MLWTCPACLVLARPGQENPAFSNRRPLGMHVTDQPKRWLHRLIPLAKLAVVGLLCWFIYSAFIQGNQTLGAHSWHVDPAWLVISGLLYLLGVLPAAIFWQRVLVSAGQEVKLGEGMRAYYVSQLGKYVPGKWMVIVLRRMLLGGPQVENTVVAASVFFETFTMLAVGSAVAAIGLIVWHTNQHLLIAASLGASC